MKGADEDISLMELAAVLLCKAQEAASDASIMSFDLIRDLEHIITSTLAAVRRMRNSCQRSISLPPEILSTIFQYVPCGRSILDDDYLAYDPSQVDIKKLIPLTHVCHRWREVALSTPSLWCRISNRHPPAFLERSGCMDLFLTVTREPKAGHFVYDLLRSHGSRIREMYWSADVTKSAVPLCAFPAPQLRSLRIQPRYSHRRQLIEPPGTVLFRGQTPRLEYISLRSYFWVPSESIFSLTRLCLSSISNLDVDAILSFLSRTPNLEDLVIIDLKFLGSSKTSSMVRLKNLVRLTFELAYGRNISALIRCLEIGSSIAVQLIDCDFGDDDGFSSLLMDLSLVPTSIGVAGMPNHDVVTFALNSSSALRFISFECAFHEDRASEPVQQYVRELWISPSVDDISSGVIAGRWVHLDTLVCCDYALEYILMLLSTPTELPCARELSTIRLIQTSSRKNIDLSAQQGVQERFMLARKDCSAIKLVIESHALQRGVGQRVTEDVEALFESVEYKFFGEVPTMAYPDVCKRGWSAKYPPWVRDGHLTS